MNRNEQILNFLVQSSNNATVRELSDLTGAPEASVRRSIQELRSLGHNISFASPSGIYRLGEPYSGN